MIAGMLDTLMGHYASYKFNGLDKKYGPEKAIESSTLFNENGTDLTVLFPPWRGGEGVYDRLTKRLVKNGAAVLRYKLHPQILEPNAERVLASFNYIQATVVEELKQLVANHDYEKINLVATSLGNVSLGLVARAFTAFDSATLIVPGSNLARCTWEGSRTQSLREAFVTTGVNADRLDELWGPIAPQAAGSSFENKEVHMVVSATDTVIPTTYQEEMAAAVLRHAPAADITRTRLGHIANVTRFCLKGPL